MQYFDIILFAIIAGVLGVRLYRILGMGSKIIIDKKENVPEKVIDIKKDIRKSFEPQEVENGIGLEYLIKVYPKFDEKNLFGAEKAFKMILIAQIMKQEESILMPYLEADL